VISPLTRLLALLLLGTMLALPLAACGNAAADSKPTPVALTDDAIGHFDQMAVVEHAGPKAQIAERGAAEPVWFSQVSDAIAYLRGKEHSREILALYVSDMAKAPAWGDPGRGNWIDADTAWFVIDSQRKGGMATPEAIPFGSKGAAEGFAATEGGRVVRLGDIPDAYVRVPGAMATTPETTTMPGMN
jgi:copper chaperone NosL